MKPKLIVVPHDGGYGKPSRKGKTYTGKGKRAVALARTATDKGVTLPIPPWGKPK